MSKLAEDFLRPFGDSQVAQLLTYADQIRRFGLDLNEVVELCRERLETKKKIAAMQTGVMHGPQRQMASPRCPKCGSGLRISRVNVSRCTNVGGDWKTSIMCDNSDCRYTELSVKTLAQWRRGL